MADEDHPFGPDLLANRLEVGDVSGEGVAPGSSSREERPVPTSS
jgi:hypothetical protein